jgi:hypothetical protein
MATDDTPNSLTRLDVPITSKYGTAQIVIFTIAGFACIYILQFMINNKTNPDIINYGTSAIICIIVAVFVGARNDFALYKSERFIVFNVKYIAKIDEIYKYSKKTKARKARNFTGLLAASIRGHLKFKIFKTHNKQKCNFGFCYTVTPSNPNDLDGFYRGLEKLYNAIPAGAMHKTTIAQSKDLTNISEVYAQKLNVKGLPLPVRQGLEAKRLYFKKIKDRVGWMYVIFMGVGYFVDEKEAHAKIDEIRDDYSNRLRFAGVTAKPVLDPQDYAIIYSQMFHMRDLSGLM